MLSSARLRDDGDCLALCEMLTLFPAGRRMTAWLAFTLAAGVVLGWRGGRSE